MGKGKIKIHFFQKAFWMKAWPSRLARAPLCLAAEDLRDLVAQCSFEVGIPTQFDRLYDALGVDQHEVRDGLHKIRLGVRVGAIGGVAIATGNGNLSSSRYNCLSAASSRAGAMLRSLPK